MNIEGHYYLGRIIKPVGIRGELLAFFDVDDTSAYIGLDVAIVAIGGNLVPFIIENLKLRHNNQVLIKFEQIEQVEQTEILSGCSLYLPLEKLPKLTGNKFYFHEIIGYEVIDKVYGAVGKVHQVLDYPMQALLEVKKGNTEILIPVADEIICKVDRRKQVLHIDAPEGLIEMYLGSKHE